MKFHLYKITVRRAEQEVCAHIVAPTRDRAWMAYIEHEEALGLTHDDLTMERVDEHLPADRRTGLDDLLENAGVVFASFAGRWIPHLAPVQQLKLYRLVDEEDGDLYAIAPNLDVVASVFTSALRIRRGEVRQLRIKDGMADMPESMVCNLARLLEFGPIGVVSFEAEKQEWSIG
jgi:hypothetical protein